MWLLVFCLIARRESVIWRQHFGIHKCKYMSAIVTLTGGNLKKKGAVQSQLKKTTYGCDFER